MPEKTDRLIRAGHDAMAVSSAIATIPYHSPVNIFWKNKKDCSGAKNILLTITETPNFSSIVSFENGALVLSTPACYQNGGSSDYRKVSNAINP